MHPYPGTVEFKQVHHRAATLTLLPEKGHYVFIPHQVWNRWDTTILSPKTGLQCILLSSPLEANEEM